MPRRKKVVKKTVKKSTREVRTTRTKKTQRNWNPFFWAESYSSFLLGVVVVIVVILFGVSIVKQQHQTRETSSLSTGPSVTISPTPGTTVVEGNKTYYVVKPNDSLYDIAQKVYNDGDKWTDIATANNVANPSTIFTGDKLLLPNAPEPSELGQLMQPSPTSVTNAITGKSYIVVAGDNLWDIAVRAYGDGYSWVKIAQANSLSDPDLIFSGNVLKVPR